MRKNNCLSILIFLCLSFGSLAQSACDSVLRCFASEQLFNTGLPQSKKTLQVIKHKAYSLGYSEPHEQASWVCYVLSKNECSGDEERASSFKEDKSVLTGSATDEDYKGKGYDRGHLAPAGDMTYDNAALNESFYFSNISPQVPSFNRGIWKKLETQVREWSELYGSCLVITGPLLTDSLPTIGKDLVAIPDLFYKIVVNPNQSPPQAIAFLMKNEVCACDLSDFVVSIDSVERLSGIDFLPALSAGCQQQLESQVNGTYWKGFEKVSVTPAAPPVTTTKKKKKT